MLSDSGLLSSVALTSKTQTLYVDADAFVIETDPNDNYGTVSGLLACGSNSGSTVMSYVMFDLTPYPMGSIPKGSTIDSVEVRLSLSHEGQDPNAGVQLGYCTTAWIEAGAGSITWNTRPTDIARLGAPINSGAASTWVWQSSDIPGLTTIVDKWLNDSDHVVNGGFTFEGSSFTDGRVFYSKEGAMGPSVQPRLVVTFTPPANVPPVIAGLPDITLNENAHFPASGSAVASVNGLSSSESATATGTYYLVDQWGGKVADVNKTFTKDHLMCWAAAASNVLEWTGWGQVTTAQAETLSDGDQMFSYFKKHWTDAGGWAGSAWSWWFDGIDPGDGHSQEVVQGGGFYPTQVFADYYHHAEVRWPRIGGLRRGRDNDPLKGVSLWTRNPCQRSRSHRRDRQTPGGFPMSSSATRSA